MNCRLACPAAAVGVLAGFLADPAACESRTSFRLRGGAHSASGGLARRSTVGSLATARERLARVEDEHSRVQLVASALSQRVALLEERIVAPVTQLAATEVQGLRVIGDGERASFDREHYPNGINANFVGAGKDAAFLEGFYAGKCGKFEDIESREIARSADAIVKMLGEQAGLRPGTHVADVGAGTGLFLTRLAEAVGEFGTVSAVELSSGFVEILERKATAVFHHCAGVSIVQCSDASSNLQTDTVDVALLCDVYHHLEQPVTFCKSLHGALRSGGRLVIIDFHRDDARMWSHPKGWVEQHVRADQKTFRAEIESAGFKLVCEPSVAGLTENYVMIFEKE